MRASGSGLDSQLPAHRGRLIVSLLEKRPILLPDEWTADQDPDFRRSFYDELLPELQQAGGRWWL